MSLQAELIKEELAMIEYELDCAREDWKKFPHSLRNIDRLVHWRRPLDFLNGTRPSLFPENFKDELTQGELPNKWLFSTISMLA